MRKIYQKEWHGIRFKDFIGTSSKCLAGANFYGSFYKYFMKKYHGWSDLEPEWLKLKLQTAEFLKGRLPGGKETKILSVGCGLGIIEKSFIESGYADMNVTEVAPEPLAWIRDIIPPHRIFIGFFPQCIPQDRRYDVIYFLGIETFLTRDELIAVLKSARSRLSERGRCVLVSWSSEPADIFNKMVFILKETIKDLLGILHIKDRGQLWGYSRNRNEFLEAVNSAGFSNINDGVIPKINRWDTYWIEGNK